MKYFLAAIIVAAFPLYGFTQNATANTKLVQDLFDVINKHDSIAVGAFFDDSAKLESPNWEGVETGRRAAITVYSRYFKGTPNIRYTITHVVATENEVVVEYTFAGKFSNPEGGSPEYMKDKEYLLKGSTRYNISHNKITNSVSYFDQVAFLRQVGFFEQH